MTLLDVDDLVVRFGTTTAVDGVSFGVASGEIVGLVGANGAGKTTTIRAALGLERPARGRIGLLGGAPSRHTRRGVGYVPQTLGLWQDLTVRQNLAFVAAAYDVEQPEPTGDLVGTLDQTVGALPLGQRRRVAFEAALSHDPRLLVLDEPTSGVGPLERTALWDRIHATRHRGVGVLVTTHHMSEAEQCDRIVAMMGGRVVASGTLSSLLGGRRTVVVATADWPAAFARLDAAFGAVALAGGSLRVPDATVPEVRRVLADLPADVTVAAASFDEVFVALGRQS